MKEDERSWRLQGIKHIILGNPIKADISKQNYSVIPLKKYQDIRIRCRKCKEWFLFSAKEQKHWYEELNFWVDSVPNKCRECSFQKRAYNDIVGGLGKLISDSENIKGQQQEIEHLIEQIIFRKLRLTQPFYSKLLNIMQKIQIDNYEELRQKLKEQIS